MTKKKESRAKSIIIDDEFELAYLKLILQCPMNKSVSDYITDRAETSEQNAAVYYLTKKAKEDVLKKLA